MKRLKRHQKVEVWWYDAWHSQSSWYANDLEKEPPYLMKTCGYLIFNNKINIALGADLDNQDRYRYVNIIPKKIVQKIFFIK